MIRYQTENTEITLDNLKRYLFRIKATKQISEENTSVVRVNIVKPSNGDNNNSKVKCHRCNKKGHIKNQCPLAAIDTVIIGIESGRTRRMIVLTKVISWMAIIWSQKFTNRNSRRKENFKVNFKDRGKGNFRDRISKQRLITITPGRNAKQAGNVQAMLSQGGKFSDGIVHNKSSTFIADSSAIKRIINKGLLLKNFIKISGEIICSANKNKSSNISVHNKRDLILKSNLETIKLTDVISVSNISDNPLILLRRFVDDIYLDDMKLKFCYKVSGSEYLTGTYGKSNWIIVLKVPNIIDLENKSTYSDKY